MMKIWFAVVKDEGKNSVINSHWGSTPGFVRVDTQSGAADYRANDQTGHHSGGGCQPLRAMTGEQVDAVVTAGIGSGAIAKLAQAGVQVFQGSPTETVQQWLDRYQAGQAAAWNPQDGCRQHGGGCGDH